jgi:hypothetical protein
VRRGRDSMGLLKMRVQFSRRIGEYLTTFGLTPRARAEFFRELKAESLASEIAARRADADEEDAT